MSAHAAHAPAPAPAPAPQALVVYGDLLKAQSGVNLETDLHVLYLITPTQNGLYPDYEVRAPSIQSPFLPCR